MQSNLLSHLAATASWLMLIASITTVMIGVVRGNRRKVVAGLLFAAAAGYPAAIICSAGPSRTALLNAAAVAAIAVLVILTLGRPRPTSAGSLDERGCRRL